jgi:hypothetical protein
MPWKLPVKVSLRSSQLSIMFHIRWSSHTLVELAYGDELDDEQVIIRPFRPARKAVVL